MSASPRIDLLSPQARRDGCALRERLGLTRCTGESAAALLIRAEEVGSGSGACTAWRTRSGHTGFSCAIDVRVPARYGASLKNASDLRLPSFCDHHTAEYVVANKWYNAPTPRPRPPCLRPPHAPACRSAAS